MAMRLVQALCLLFRMTLELREDPWISMRQRNAVIGLPIPRPELALFKHKVPANAFLETVPVI